MNRTVLLKTLKAINPAVNSAGLVPAHSHFCFEGGYVTAYDDVVAMWSACPLPIQGGVDASKLSAIVNSLDTEQVDVTGIGDEVIVKGGRTKLVLKTLPITDFTFQMPQEPCHVLKWDTSWTGALKRCLLSISEDMEKSTGITRTGITISCSSKSVDLYSTDTASMVKASIVATVPVELVGKAIILSPKFCSTLAKTLDTHTCLTLQIANSFAYATFSQIGSVIEELYLLGKLIPGADVAQFQKVLQATSAGLQYTTVPPELAKGVERSLLVGGTQLTASVARGELQLLTRIGNGEIEDKMLINHPDVSIVLAPDRFKPAIPFGSEVAISKACVSLRTPGFVWVLSAKI